MYSLGASKLIWNTQLLDRCVTFLVNHTESSEIFACDHSDNFIVIIDND